MFSKVFGLLGSKNKKYFFLIILMNFFGVILEAIGIGSVLPVILAITEVDIYEKYEKFNFIFELIDYPERKILILYSVIFLVSVFLTKNFFLIIFTIVNNKFIYGISKELTNSLFERYLNYNYHEFIKQNIGKLMRNILNEINQFTVGILMPIITLITEITLFFVFFYILISYEPKGTIIIFIFLSIIFLLIYLPVKKKLKIWGEKRQKNEGFKIDTLNQGLHGFKDIKIFNIEKIFSKKFEEYNSNSIYFTRNQVILQQLPKYFFEIFAILSISFLLFFFIKNDTEFAKITGTLGLYAASIFRLMPSFNRILGSLQSLRFANTVLKNLYNVFSETEKNNILAKDKVYNSKIKNFSFNKSVEFKNIEFGYDEKKIFNNLNLRIKKNQFIGLLGDSGSGKSTFVDLLSGLLIPKSGQIILDEKYDILSNEYKKNWQSLISYVPQKVTIFNESIYENITLKHYNENADDMFFDQVIKECNLKQIINEMANKEKTIIGAGAVGLSGGQVQRIGIARAIYRQPEILILDEATNALDEGNEKLIINLLNSMREKITIIIITHKKSLLKNCDKIIEIGKNSLNDEKTEK